MTVERVKIGEYLITNGKQQLAIYGLGSCVGIFLYDPEQRVGGLAHTLLPTCPQHRELKNPGKYVETAVNQMIEEMEEMGARRERMLAKIVGGAHMFQMENNSESPTVGQQNLECAQQTLESMGIEIVGMEAGGSMGRSFFVEPGTGKAYVKTLHQGIKEV